MAKKSTEMLFKALQKIYEGPLDISLNDMSYDDYVEYISKKYDEWAGNELNIIYTQDNIKNIIRESNFNKGVFLYRCYYDDQRIDVRAKNKEDLLYLKLKYNF